MAEQRRVCETEPIVELISYSLFLIPDYGATKADRANQESEIRNLLIPIPIRTSSFRTSYFSANVVESKNDTPIGVREINSGE